MRDFWLFLLLGLGLSVVFGSMFGYVFVNVNVDFVSPPLIFEDIGTDNVNVSISVNKTLSEIDVKARSGSWQIVGNPGYEDNADGWFFGNPDPVYIDSPTWYSSYSGAIGVLYMGGTVPGGESDFAYFITGVHVPSDIDSMVINIRHQQSLGGLGVAYLVVGLYDPDQGQTVWSTNVGLSSSSSWSVDSFNVDLSSVELGKDYYFYYGVYDYSFLSWFSSSVDAYFDYSEIIVSSEKITFSGDVIAVNSTAGSYLVRMRVFDEDISGKPNVTVRLVNTTFSNTSDIVVENGVLIDGETSEVELSEVSSLYYSGKIHVDTVLSSENDSVVLGILLLYKTVDGAVSNFLETKISIVDPAGNYTVVQGEGKVFNLTDVLCGRLKAFGVVVDEIDLKMMVYRIERDMWFVTRSVDVDNLMMIHVFYSGK